MKKSVVAAAWILAFCVSLVASSLIQPTAVVADGASARKASKETANLDAHRRLNLQLPELREHVETIKDAIAEFETSDAPGDWAVIEVTPFVLPEAGVDVMRVRLEETYSIDGIGTDTVELNGWVAVAHTTPRAALGETEIAWGTAISDTEFVGLSLSGHSPVFGQVVVTLDPDRPSVGAVGKLDLGFLPRVSLDLTFRKIRDSAWGYGGAPPGIQGRAMLSKPIAESKVPSWNAEAEALATGLSRERSASVSSQERTGTEGDRRQVERTLRGLWDAISKQNADEMLTHFARGEHEFFNAALAQLKVESAEEYVRQLSLMFETIRSIEVIPNDDLTVRFGDSWAVATVTGRNEVVDMENRRGTGPWRYTVQLEKQGERWLIVGDHLSFFNDPNAPMDAAMRGAGVCNANISASISMPELNLKMATAFPVRWYSEVVTIPPVGETASISMTPTPLVAQGRQVGTLDYGIVKFREVVRHVPFLSDRTE